MKRSHILSMIVFLAFFLLASCSYQLFAQSVLLNPTTSQTVSQPSNTGFGLNLSDCGLSSCISTNVKISHPSTPAGTDPGYIARFDGSTAYGYGKNIGNPPGVTDIDGGWTVSHPNFFQYNIFRSGISQANGGVFNHFGGGDSAFLYLYPVIDAGQTDASGEGNTVIKVNGTQELGWYHGSVSATTGAGDTTPILSSSTSKNPNHQSGGSFLMDISKPVTSGNLAGKAAPWLSTYLNILPVSNSLTPSNAYCETTSYIASSTVLDVPQNQTVTCEIKPGFTAPVAGQIAWIASNANPEVVMIVSSTTNGTTATLTVASYSPHPQKITGIKDGKEITIQPGSIILQGGPTGCLSFDTDLAVLGQRTSFQVFGASDSSHLIFGEPFLGNMAGADFPETGYQAETPSSPYTVYPCARVLSIDSQAQNPILETNNIPWAVNDIVEDPQNSAYQESGITLVSSQQTQSNPSYSNSGFLIAMGGPGHAGAAYTPMMVANYNDPNLYQPSGPLAPMGAYWATGTFGATLVFDELSNGFNGAGGCGNFGTVLCNRNSNYETSTFAIYAEGNSQRRLLLDRTSNVLRTYSLGIQSDLSMNAFSGFQVNGNAPTGSYLRGDGTNFVASSIIASDVPALPYAPLITSSTAMAAGGSGITSVTCITASCTNIRGTYTVIGGTATTGTLVTLSWSPTPSAYVCNVVQNDMGAATDFKGIGHSVATTTGMTVSAGLSVSGTTFSFDYSCQP